MATAGVPSGTILAVHLKEMFAFIKRNKSDAKKIEFQYNKTINACT
jgi:orotate phosphoribosyltransferase